MLYKLWFFWIQSRIFYFKPNISLKDNCSFQVTFNFYNDISKPLLSTLKFKVTMSLNQKHWYPVLAHEIGHLLDKDRTLGNHGLVEEMDKEYLFESELKAWINAREILLDSWTDKYKWEEFKKAVTYGLGSYLSYCYEPQYRADVWCRVEKDLGIRDNYKNYNPDTCVFYCLMK